MNEWNESFSCVSLAHSLYPAGEPRVLARVFQLLSNSKKTTTITATTAIATTFNYYDCYDYYDY